MTDKANPEEWDVVHRGDGTVKLTRRHGVADPTQSDSFIEAALEELRLTLAGKNEDYRIDGEFSNFEFAAKVAGLTTEHVMLTQIGIKLGRLKGLGEKRYINNESVLDSYKDLAGYAIIAYAHMLSQADAEEDWDV